MITIFMLDDDLHRESRSFLENGKIPSKLIRFPCKGIHGFVWNRKESHKVIGLIHEPHVYSFPFDRWNGFVWNWKEQHDVARANLQALLMLFFLHCFV